MADTSTPSRAFHIGILVGDIEAAVKAFSEALGVTFPGLMHAEVTVEEDPLGTHLFQTRAAYSNEGPPYIELIEANGTGVWGTDKEHGLHHIGVYDTDLLGHLACLVNAGNEPQTRVSFDGDLVSVYMPPAFLHGCRIEYVDIYGAGGPGPIERPA